MDQKKQNEFLKSKVINEGEFSILYNLIGFCRQGIKKIRRFMRLIISFYEN